MKLCSKEKMMHKKSIRNLIKNAFIKVYLIYFTIIEMWKSKCPNCKKSLIWDFGIVGRMWWMKFHDQILFQTWLIDPNASLHNIYSTIKHIGCIWEIDVYQRIFDISKMSSKISKIVDAEYWARNPSIWEILTRY